ncbi:crossover junction endonuclease EME1, partial [Schistosoma japonicum]
KSVCKQLASLIQPKNVGVNGLSGSVPISYSVTWTHEWVEIMLDALIEPEVVILSQSSLSSINTSSHITCVTSNLHDVALFLNSITRSLAKRHFKQGRLERDEGLSFLPETIRKGLSSFASRERGSGKVTPMNNDIESLNSIDQEKTSHLWASRVWLAQLGQWHGLTGEIAHAITLVYPTARSFYVACKSAEIQSQKQVVLHLNSNPQVEPSSSSRSTNQKYIHPFEIELANL